MQKDFKICFIYLFILIGQWSKGNDYWKIQPDENVCPPEDEWVISQVDLNSDGSCERVRVVESIPFSINDPKKFPGYWQGDCFRLTIEDFKKDYIYSEDFCTAYGNFKIFILNLNGSLNYDFVFELYKYRGTNVTQKYYLVKHWDGRKLIEKFTIPAGMWFEHDLKESFSNISSPLVNCSKDIIFSKISDKQYEATIFINSDCEEYLNYLIPKSKDQQNFLKNKKQKLVYDKNNDNYYLFDINE